MAFDPNAHMMRLKGRDYLQVAWRLVWFREVHPDWTISTECVEHDAEHALFRASIHRDDGALAQSAYGSETRKDFADYIEKAETKAVGRALAMLGFGTQFAPDMDEDDTLADAPLDRTPPIDVSVICADCGAEIMPVKHGETMLTAAEIVAKSKLAYGKTLCFDCCKERAKAARQSAGNGGKP